MRRSLDDVRCLLKARLMPIVAVRRPTCLAPCARCCTPPVVPGDTRTLLRAAYRLPDAARTFLGCIARCRASFARCRAALRAAQVFMQRPSALRGAAKPAQYLTIYLMRVRMNRIALIVVQRPLGLVMKATFLIKCGIVNLVLRQNRQASSWPFA